MSTDNNDTGVVKFFNQNKGFGFISPDAGSKDVFVHLRCVKSGQLCDGAKVKFTTESTAKGLSAVDVEVMESDSSTSSGGRRGDRDRV